MKKQPVLDHPTSAFHLVRNKGQVLVVFAVSLLALLFFIGLALDAGIVYVNYGQLKRAIDSGSVAAANNFKRGGTNAQMYAAVLEVLKLQNVNVDPSSLHLIVTTCDMNGDGWRDGHFPADTPLPTEFFPLCPDTNPTNINSLSARKLVYVEAQQRTPLYFLSLMGIGSVNLKTFSIAEAASVDLVLVIDTSESMGNKSPSYIVGTNSTDYDPKLCNSYWDTTVTPHVFHPSTCDPLNKAMDAANKLVDTLYAGYDNISVITFDTVGHDPNVDSRSFHLTSLVGGNTDAVKQRINEIQLHDDAPYYNLTQNKMWPDWYTNMQFEAVSKINPANMEDRDGDGSDADPGKPCWVDASGNPRTPDPDELNFHWVINHPEDPGNNGPCDFADKKDAYDWNYNGTYDDPADSDAGAAWLGSSHNTNFSLVSTCTGCGIRLASNELKKNGRPGAVWVIVLLSDGGVNMSDTYSTLNDPDIIPIQYPNGFCTQYFWNNQAFCKDSRLQDKANYANDPYRKRFCLDKTEVAVPPAVQLPDAATCPPGSSWVNPTLPVNNTIDTYSVFDYALDMVDQAALTVHTNASNPSDPLYNKNEPLGNDIAIYAVGLSTDVQKGVPLLRYAAAVGDDGDRVTDECLNKITNLPLPYQTSCGQYYYAATGADLLPIFDSIASRIYTKITH